VLRCELNVNFQSIYPPCTNTKPPIEKFLGSAELLSASGTKEIITMTFSCEGHSASGCATTSAVDRGNALGSKQEY